MISNATITRIDVVSGEAVDATPIYAEGAAVSLRCLMAGPTRAQKWTLGAVINDRTSLVIVMESELQPGQLFAEGTKINVALDGEAAQTLRIKYARHWVKAGGLSNWELFGEAA